MKKLTKYIGFLLLGLVIAILLVPFLFKSDIIELIKKESNEHIEGSLDFSDVSISFIRSFPDVSIKLKDFVLQSDQDPDGSTLLTAESLDLNVDIMSFLKKDITYQINEIELNQADISLYIHPNGKANYQISNPSQGSSTPYKLNLSDYKIQNSTFSYIDNKSDVTITAKDINHQGEGDFTNTIYDLKHLTQAKDVNVSANGIKYLNSAQLNGNMTTNIDQDQNKYTIQGQQLKINNLTLNTDGFFQVKENEVFMDLKIDGLNEKLEELLSIIPYVFKENISDLTMSGFASISTKMKGSLNAERSIYPSIDFNIKTKDGEIGSTNFNEKIKQFNSDISITANEKDWSDLKIQIPEFSLNLDGEPVLGKFITSNILDDPEYILLGKGKIDLAKLHQLTQSSLIEEMDGVLDLSLDFEGKQSDIDQRNYTNLRFSNSLKSTKAKIKLKDRELIEIQNLNVTSTPQKINAEALQLKYGESDFLVNGSINDPVQFLVNQSQASGDITIKSNTLNLDQIIDSGDQKAPNTISEIPSHDLQFNYEADFSNIIYQNYDITNSKLKGSTTLNSFKVTNASADVNGSTISGSGEFNNTYPYIMNSDTLYGEVNINSNNLNLTKFLAGEETTQSVDPLRIPKNVSLLVNATAPKLVYEDYDLTKVVSQIVISKGVALFSDASANTCDGNVKFEGAYYSHTEDPLFSFKYNIKNFSFQKFYKSANRFKKLAPIAAYINGHFNSDLTMTGKLSDGFLPDLSTISAEGFLETLDSKIEGFKPLENLGNTLGVSELKKFAIDNTRNWLQIKEGSIIIKPQDYEFSGIKMNIGGSQNINQQIDYIAKLQIPRALFKDGGTVTTGLDQGLDKLSKEASSLGVDIFSGDYIYLVADIKGSFLDPKIKITPTGSGGKSLTEQAKDELKDRANEIKKKYTDQVKDKVEETTDTVKQVIEKEVDELNEKVDSVIDKKVEEATDKVTDIIQNQIDTSLSTILSDTIATEIKDQVEDLLNNKGGEIDKIKEKLKDIKIFKKKKGI